MRCKHCGEDDKNSLEIIKKGNGWYIILCSVCSKETKIYEEVDSER